MTKNIVSTLHELVWNIRLVNLIVHCIIVFHGIVAIPLNERHVEMMLNKINIVNFDNAHAVLDHGLSIFNNTLYYNITGYNSDTLKHVR